jgi:hypothetical protein
MISSAERSGDRPPDRRVQELFRHRREKGSAIQAANTSNPSSGHRRSGFTQLCCHESDLAMETGTFLTSCAYQSQNSIGKLCKVEQVELVDHGGL